MSLPPSILRRVMREVNDLKKTPPEGIRVQTSEEDILDITGIIQGPEGTPYAGGYFNIKFKFTENFPTVPPKCWFATKIFHPNVSSSGEICVNTLKKDWQPTYGIEHILVTVKCLLIYPNPESALDEEAGKLLLENYSSYCQRAKLITSVHATPRQRPAEFHTSPPSSSALLPVPTSPPTGFTVNSGVNFPGLTPVATPLTLPTSSQKTAINCYPPKQVSGGENEGVGCTGKERHVSPSPLSIADANVGLLGTAACMGVSSAAPAITKSGKRAATGSTATNAEKRKKALKRL